MATTIDDRRETVSLIGSDKVEGTAVYGADENKIGSVQRIMIDKISGRVAYAVVSFGGYLGIGEDYYPVPWPQMKYDTNIRGYRLGDRGPVAGRTEIRSRSGMGLERSRQGRVRVPIL
jgi:PRC-barrel domain